MRLPAYIKDNLLLKITSLNSGAMSIRMLLAFILQKILAVFLGPEGVAQIGNLRNVIPIIESFSTLGIFNGIVKYVAEYKDDKEELQKLFSTSFVYITIASLVTFCILFFGAEYLNDLVFGEKKDLVIIFKALAMATPFIAMNRIFNGIVNGVSAYKPFIKINLISYTLSVIILMFFLYYKRLDGVLFAIAITPILQFILLFYFFYNILKEYVKFNKISFEIPYKKELIAFTLMSFSSTILSSVIDLNLRVYLINNISEIDAGNWTGMTNISKQYFMFITTILTLYIIPKFSRIKTSMAFRLEVINIYKTLLPMFALGMILIYFCREWVVIIAKSKEFIEMKILFKWQLMGDFIRIASLILMHQFLAKKLVRSFMFSEIISLGLFYFLANYLVSIYGVEGVVMAHFFRYIIYFFVVLYLVTRYFKKQDLIECIKSE